LVIFVETYPGMKKTLIIIFLLISAGAFAQHKPFQFGFKGAVNIGWMGSNAKGYENEGVNFGGAWGFVADIYMMENYSFTTGFDVVYLNGTLSYPYGFQDTIDNITPGRMESEFKSKYIEIPVIFTMKTNEIGKLRYYGQIGFGMGFRLNTKADNTFTPDNGGATIVEEGTDPGLFKTTREALILGIGIEVPVSGSTYIRTGIKYDNAFINVMKGNNTFDFNLANNARNSFIELNLCVIF